MLNMSATCIVREDRGPRRDFSRAIEYMRELRVPKSRVYDDATDIVLVCTSGDFRN